MQLKLLYKTGVGRFGQGRFGHAHAPLDVLAEDLYIYTASGYIIFFW